MPKFCGAIGFACTRETSPGVYTEEIVERNYSGDLIRNTRRLQSSGQVNDDLNISNQISILADPYACQNIYMMRYATFMDAKWKITDVQVEHPRLLLTLGGVYNGQST